MEEKAQRVFQTRSGNANFSCPECGALRTMDVSKFQDIDKEIKLKCTCKCKHVFSVVLERRLQIRKKVNLNGEVLLDQKRYPVDIINISRHGLRIRTRGRLDISLLDKVVIDFVLDDSTHSRVSKVMIARTMRENEIGLEFVDGDHYDKLGSYLLFHFQ